MYNCLTIADSEDSIASLNLGGSFTVFGRSNSSIPGERIWNRCLSEDGLVSVLDDMTKALGLTPPTKLPATTPEVLVYRVIASLVGTSLLDQNPLQCLNGQFDSSGGTEDLRRPEWFAKFPTAARTRDNFDRSVCLCGNPNYHFWFLLRGHGPVLAFSTDGFAHLKDGSALNLMSTYRKRGSLIDVVRELLPHFDN